MDENAACYELLKVGEIVPEGWMRRQMLGDLRGFAGHLDELTEEARKDSFGVNRAQGAEGIIVGKMNPNAWRWWWSGETQGCWLDGLVRMAFLVSDPFACDKVRSLLDHVLACQEKDGYLGVYKPEARFNHPSSTGELWTQSRIMLALLAYYEATGNAAILQAVSRGVDLTMSHYGLQRSYFHGEKPDGGTAHGLMFVDVLEWLHRITGQARYLEFAEFLYHDFCTSKTLPYRDNGIENLLDPAKLFQGHTPHTMEQLRVLLWLASATGKEIYGRCAEAALAKTLKHLTVSAACIGDENIRGRSPTGEMFYEYCAQMELMASLHSRTQKSGEMRWADLVERLVFNAAQGARFADGMGISYLTQDNRRLAARACGFKGRAKYSPTHEDVAVCCNPAAVKLLPYHVGRMWLRQNGPRPGLAAICYGPSRLSTRVGDSPVRIVQRTQYPFEERVTFEIQHADAVAMVLEFRVPAWAKRAILSVGDQHFEASAGGRLRVDRTWRSGDRAVLDLEAAVSLEQSCDAQAVVVRGPLVFAAPLGDQRRSTKDYTLEGFHDYDIEPAGDEAWNFSMPRGPAKFDLHRRAGESADPWEKSPLELRGQLIGPDAKSVELSLVPMGCTVLRRVTFPWVGQK